MISRTLVAACSLAAGLCLTAAAQTAAPTPPSAAPATPQSPAQAPGPAPAQQPAPALQLHDLPQPAHTPTPEEAEQQRQERILAAATRMASAQARWGPEISTPGMSVTLQEEGRSKTAAGATEIAYHVTGAGFPAGEKFSLLRWPLNGNAETLMSGIVLNAQGTAVCAAGEATGVSAQATPGAAAGAKTAPAAPAGPPCTGTMQPNQPVEIRTTAAAGEAIRVALVAEDHKNGAATTAVPFPIAGVDKSCKLQVLLGLKEAEMVLVEGTGFPPNTAMKLDTTTYGATQTLNTKTNPAGRMVVLLLPGVKGHDSGDTTVRFGGVTKAPSLETPKTEAPAAPECAPAVTFHWGKGSYKAE